MTLCDRDWLCDHTRLFFRCDSEVACFSSPRTFNSTMPARDAAELDEALKKKGGLTLSQLANYDDLITDALVDRVSSAIGSSGALL